MVDSCIVALRGGQAKIRRGWESLSSARPRLYWLERLYVLVLDVVGDWPRWNNGSRGEALERVSGIEQFLRMNDFPIPTGVPFAAIEAEVREPLRCDSLSLGVSQFIQDTAIPFAFSRSVLRTPWLEVRPMPIAWHGVGTALANREIDAAIHNRSILLQTVEPVRPHYPPLFAFRGHSLYANRAFIIEALESECSSDLREALTRSISEGTLSAITESEKACLFRTVRAARRRIREDGMPRVLMQPQTDLELAARATLSSWGLVIGEDYEPCLKAGRLREFMDGEYDVYSAGLSEAFFLDGQKPKVLPLVRRGEMAFLEVDGVVSLAGKGEPRPEVVRETIRMLHDVQAVVRALVDRGDDRSLALMLRRASEVWQTIFAAKNALPGDSLEVSISVKQFREIVEEGYEILFGSASEAVAFFAPRVVAEALALSRSQLVHCDRGSDVIRIQKFLEGAASASTKRTRRRTRRQ